MAQLVRTPICKHETLNLDPSTYVQSQKCDICCDHQPVL